jgi:HK97 family phage prohead protease
MSIIRRLMPGDVKALGDDEVEAILSTDVLARDGHVLVPEGADLANFRRNPIILWQHMPTEPVGRAENIEVKGNKIVAKIRFAPAGVSPTADQIRGLVKSGIITTMSVGFEVRDSVPLDPSRPRGGQRITSWEPIECSFVSCPADTGAVVTARADAEWKVGASRGLPIEDSDEWDAAAAEASIFEHAGGDDFNPATARKGFLVYDAAKPKLRGSYKLPIAHVVDGEMKVPKGAIRAAASRLPQTDIPDAVREKAQAVLDHYKEKAGMTQDNTEGRGHRAPRVRDMDDCAALAWVLYQLDALHSEAELEAEIEGDNSKVPAMLGEALKQLGASLVAMTQEEVAELLAGHAMVEDAEIDDLPGGERGWVRAAATPRGRAWRYAFAKMRIRAGKALNAANVKRLQDAVGHLNRALGKQDALARHHAVIGNAVDAASDHHAKASGAHDAMGEALAAANAAPDEAPKHIARAMRHHRAIAGALDGMEQAHQAAADGLDEGQAAAGVASRAVGMARRCVRSVLGEDADSKEIQTSDGTDESDGSANGRAMSAEQRRRRIRLLALPSA